MSQPSSPVAARLRRRVPVLICRKCLKRAPDGGDIRKAMKRALQQRGRDLGVKPRMIATGCFGICPKRAIVAASGATLDRGEVLIVAHAATTADAASTLLRDVRPKPG